MTGEELKELTIKDKNSGALEGPFKLHIDNVYHCIICGRMMKSGDSYYTGRAYGHKNRYGGKLNTWWCEKCENNSKLFDFK